VDAQNAQIWTASIVIDIEPKSAQIGGSGTSRIWTLMTERDRPVELPSGRPAVLSAGQMLAMSGAIIAAI
jgi:hypothetical protein